MVVLFIIAVALPILGLVPLKMLPFDNKNNFLVVADLPDDAPLESTQEALRDFGGYLATVKEVDNVTTFAGVNAPIDFNGLVRHYYLMGAPHQGQLRVNLATRSAAPRPAILWPFGSARPWRRSPAATKRGWPSWKCLRGRRSCRPW